MRDSERDCAFCHRIQGVELVKYSTRHYAHARCLVNRKGWAWMISNLPDYPLGRAARILHHSAASLLTKEGPHD